MGKNKNYLDKKYIIERSNQLNQLRPFELSLTEIRFMSVYQSKINAREPNKTLISFTIDEFIAIMEFKQLNITILRNKAREMMSRTVLLPKDDGGFCAMPLWSKLELTKNTQDEWVVNLDCNQHLKPYLFEMQRKYFKYELWNALRLNSTNQVRMYEILKQYEHIGTRTVEIEALKAMLGVEPAQYKMYSDFRKYVLDSCQQALQQNTDIKYTYEPVRKARGKIVAITFHISKNKDYIDKLRLSEFIKQQDVIPVDSELQAIEFNSQQDLEIIEVNSAYIKPITLSEKRSDEDYNQRFHDYLKGMGKNYAEAQQLINEANAVVLDKKRSGGIIHNSYEYTKGIINNKLEQEKQRAVDAKEKHKKPEKEQLTQEQIAEFESFAVNSKENIEKYYRNQENLNDEVCQTY